jgi:hypothetical protein
MSRRITGSTQRSRQSLSQVGAYYPLQSAHDVLIFLNMHAGSPAQWTGRAVPFTLQPDSNSNFIDQNSARSSEYPMLPLFAAADAIHGKKAPVDWPNVDVITDRNGLRKLLRWLSPSAGREVRDFRIDIDLIGTKTILLSRWESRNREPPTGRSFGFGFETAMTRPAPGCSSSTHHRAITYVRCLH